MIKLVFLMFILVSCGVKKSIDYQPIPVQKKEQPSQDSPTKDTLLKSKPAQPIPNKKTYKYMKRIVHRNNPVA